MPRMQPAPVDETVHGERRLNAAPQAISPEQNHESHESHESEDTTEEAATMQSGTPDLRLCSEAFSDS